MDLKDRLERWRERFVMAFVWRLPHWVIYWSTVRLLAYATTHELQNEEAPAVHGMDALRSYGEKG